MTIKRIVLLLFVFITYSSFSQKNIDPTLEDIVLAKQLREKNSKSDVAVLSSYSIISFGLNSKEGKVTVNHSLRENLMNITHRTDIQKYEFYDSESMIENFRLKYRNEKNAYFLVKDEFYKNDDLFYNDARVKYMNVDFPVQGYTYFYELDKKYKDVKYFTTVYLNDDYPVVKKEITIVIPSWLELEIKEFNFKGFEIKKTEKKDEKAKTTTYTYTIENVAPTPVEKATPGPSYIYPHLMLIAKSYTKDNQKTTLFNATSDLYKWYKSLVDLMQENPALLKEKVKELTEKATSDEEKIKNIYYWVQDNIRYIAFEDGIAGFKPDESQNVFQKRYGDCKGMANLTKQMLKEAGFDARLTWIGTKRIAYDYTTPSLSVDNHMICTLLFKGKKYFLDGTEKYNSFGEYAERIQGKEVLIENGTDFIIEKIPATNAAANTETLTSTFHIENESLIGNTKNTFLGESRASFLYNYNNTKTDKKEEALQEYITDRDKNFTVTNITTSDLKNRDKMLSLEYNTKLDNKVSSFDNDLYIDLDFKKEFATLDFKERKNDYEFPYKENYESTIKLEIPAGYKVVKLPESISFSKDNLLVDISYQQVGNEIIYKKQFTFKNGVIKSADFTDWNPFLEKLSKIYNEQITLTKS
ncbi:transglutaminase domain-containing protein [Flavobacterium sp. GT3R68]|uniref:transglutaminase domain-containing protein n=1 Tax=Flavobacterium sp. GT3R68 TaxID=2594437 RepID=UPI0021053CD1|nr:transglutaminase domain-containing protein [Flavobacterium sp. GT3R68]